MADTVTMAEIEAGIAAHKAMLLARAEAVIEDGKLFAVRCAYGNKAGRAMVSRIGAQWEPVSKLWVARARAANMGLYAELFRDGLGVEVLSGAAYKAAYNAARA